MEQPITYFEWLDKFKPIMVDDRPLDVGFSPAHRQVPEDDFQLALKENRIWTLVDADEGACVVSGAAYVNRLEYYICEVAVPDGISYYEIED